MPLMLSDNTVTDEAEAINNLTAFHWVPRHGGSFTRGKTAGSWGLPLTCIQCRGYEWVELYLH